MHIDKWLYDLGFANLHPELVSRIYLNFNKRNFNIMQIHLKINYTYFAKVIQFGVVFNVDKFIRNSMLTIKLEINTQ